MNDDDPWKELEERFGEFDHQAQERELLFYQQNKKEIGFSQDQILPQIKFGKQISPKLKKLIQQFLPQILAFANDYGIDIRKIHYTVYFLTTADYSLLSGQALPAHLSLPTSQVKYQYSIRRYQISVILPTEVRSSEEFINIVRTCLFRLVGHTYFQEVVGKHDLYQYARDSHIEGITVALPDQISLITSLEFPSAMLKNHTKFYAKQFRLSPVRQRTQIHNQMRKQWLEEWEKKTLSTQEEKIIQTCFQDLLHSFQQQPDSFLQNFIAEIETQNRQTNFLLPHEMKHFSTFEEESQLHYIQAVGKQLEELQSLLGFSLELAADLETVPDGSTLEGYFEQLHTEMKRLQAKGKVRLFLLPQVSLTPQLKQQQQKFSLRLIKLLPKNLDLKQWKKEIHTLEKRYQRSIYQNLFSAWIYLKHWMEDCYTEQGHVFKKTEEYQQLQQLLKGFQFRLTQFERLSAMLATVYDFRALIQKPNSRNAFPLQEFKDAWSYVISSILIHQYFLRQHQQMTKNQRFHPQKYLDGVMKFAIRQMNMKIPSFRIVYLLLRVYHSRPTDGLEFLVYLARFPQPSLRYTLRQVLFPPQKQDASAEEQTKYEITKLLRYAEVLLAVYQERRNQDIELGE